MVEVSSRTSELREQEVRRVLREEDWMVKIDYKRAFHTIAVKGVFRKCLRIQWRSELLEFQVMPQGLTMILAFFHGSNGVTPMKERNNSAVLCK